MYSINPQVRHDRPHRSGPKTSEAQFRLRKLEEIVAGLMRASSNASESLTEHKSFDEAAVNQRLKSLSVDNLPRKPDLTIQGHLDHRGSETNYHGATHWATTLENVCHPCPKSLGHNHLPIADARHPGRSAT